MAAPASLLSLLGWCLRLLVVAQLVGLAVSVPLALFGAGFEHRLSARLHALPPDDEALAAALRADPENAEVEVRRGAGTLEVELWRRTPSFSFAPLLGEHGYVVAEFTVDVGLVRDARFFLGMMLGLQAGLAYVVVRERRRPKGGPVTGLGLSWRALAWGCAGGAGLIVLGIGYDALARALGWDEARGAGPWEALAKLSPAGRACLAVLGSTLAPLCEEFFFRGLVLDRFAAAGRVRAGLWIGALVFAGVHFDPPRLPVYLAFGLVLGALRLRTAGLCAPILAHVLNNALALATLAGE